MPTSSRTTAFSGKASAEYEIPPVWVGELYLEFHPNTSWDAARYETVATTPTGNFGLSLLQCLLTAVLVQV